MRGSPQALGNPALGNRIVANDLANGRSAASPANDHILANGQIAPRIALAILEGPTSEGPNSKEPASAPNAVAPPAGPSPDRPSRANGGQAARDFADAGSTPQRVLAELSPSAATSPKQITFAPTFPTLRGPATPPGLGPSASVTVGTMILSASADPSRGQAMITGSLAGAPMRGQLLSAAAPDQPVDASLGDGASVVSAKGHVWLALRPAPDYSSVEADLMVTSGGVDTPFRGAVAAWVATAEPVVGEYTTIISGDLSTKTTVRGLAGNIATFEFYSGSLMMGAVTATQLAPRQVFPNALIAGQVKVEAGAGVTLTIPSSISPGGIFLQATVSGATTPPTPISASVAQWPLPGPTLPMAPVVPTATAAPH